MQVARLRALLPVVALFMASLHAGIASAQDPRASEAQKAAREWLVLSDRGDAAASWKSAGKQFQEAINTEGWAEAFGKVRPQLGAVVERSVLSTEFAKSFPGAPDGEYALIVFRTSFAKKADSRETLTLERETDGNWRVIGYFIS